MKKIIICLSIIVSLSLLCSGFYLTQQNKQSLTNSLVKEVLNLSQETTNSQDSNEQQTNSTDTETQTTNEFVPLKITLERTKAKFVAGGVVGELDKKSVINGGEYNQKIIIDDNSSGSVDRNFVGGIVGNASKEE